MQNESEQYDMMIVDEWSVCVGMYLKARTNNNRQLIFSILTKSSNEDLIEYTLIAIFTIFAYLIFTGHF